MVSRISFVHGIHLDPAIGNVLIIILIQEHLAAERFDTEIATLITAPKGKNPYSKAEEERTDRFHLPEDVHIHERQHGYVSDNFLARVYISLGTVTRTSIAEKHITDFFHCLRVPSGSFSNLEAISNTSARVFSISSLCHASSSSRDTPRRFLRRLR